MQKILSNVKNYSLLCIVKSYLRTYKHTQKTTQMETTYKEIKGIEVANTAEFWGAYYEDRSRMLKGALEQRTFAMIEYGDKEDDYNNRVFVSIQNLPFGLVAKIHTAAQDLARDLNIVSGHEDGYFSIESRFTNDGRLIIEIHETI